MSSYFIKLLYRKQNGSLRIDKEINDAFGKNKEQMISQLALLERRRQHYLSSLAFFQYTARE